MTQGYALVESLGEVGAAMDKAVIDELYEGSHSRIICKIRQKPRFLRINWVSPATVLPYVRCRTVCLIRRA
jgi:hypothetical protein